MHINVKELKAAIHTVMSLAKKNQTILLAVDNQVTFYYLTKGKEESYERHPMTIFQLVPRAQGHPPSEMGSVKGNVGGQNVKVGFRQGR